ncbi:hypothetical protein JCM19241_5790 [Vibrio ishigakensis]|uniref:Uncharacterized protein n=1 Tax=Vibrio ishigakensis TaxID=1481914 RepID=A0A0B8QRM4_9VIBR|nr:hypothetical protein JCM19236_4594 [Vibrio sp. JCM 19236]GAM76894.1 hypothetical protein JCM19241_5790 [Vibrio ishigakensis]
MLKSAFVRLIVGGLMLMGMTVNPIYFLAMALLMNTHRRELFAY